MKSKIDNSRTEYLAETSRVVTVGTFKHLLCCVGGLQKNPHQVVCVSFLAQGSFQSCDTPTFTSPSTIPVSAQAARPVAAPGRRAELCLLSFVFLGPFWFTPSWVPPSPFWVPPSAMFYLGQSYLGQFLLRPGFYFDQVLLRPGST